MADDQRSKIAGNRFRIAGGRPGLRVSWQVTGIRQDAWAEARRIPVEEVKPLAEQGRFPYPELFGQPPELAVSMAPGGEGPPLETAAASAPAAAYDGKGGSR